jgi:hypothetical protein
MVCTHSIKVIECIFTLYESARSTRRLVFASIFPFFVFCFFLFFVLSLIGWASLRALLQFRQVANGVKWLRGQSSRAHMAFIQIIDRQ